MDYPRALEHLHALTNYEVIPRAGRIEGLSLENMRSSMAALADPQASYPVIHVTGTNGKGSTVRLIESLLRVMGLRVGTYTSPHLQMLNERIRIGGVPIADHDLASAITGVAAVGEELDGESLTWFETMTAAALTHFADEAVDVAVLEVGMLGRFDATNVADAQIAVVTNIGLDHTDGVGDWRRAIAQEKAGIIKPGSALVLGETDPDLAAVFAAESPSTTWERGIDFDVAEDELAVGGRMINLRSPRGRYDEVFLRLHGHHQADNAAVAVASVEEFFDVELAADVVTEAFGSVEIPGRMEVVARSPLVMLDVAHNPPGAEALADGIETDFGDSPVIMVIGLLDGRDPRAYCEALQVSTAEICIACSAPSRRSLPAESVAGAITEAGGTAEVVHEVEEAIERAYSLAGPENMIVVVGSHTVVGNARTHLEGK